MLARCIDCIIITINLVPLDISDLWVDVQFKKPLGMKMMEVFNVIQ